MDRKLRVHELIKQIAEEILNAIKEQEAKHPEGWVPAAQVKNGLELNFISVPKVNKQYGEKGWFFAIIARMLEDEKKIEYKKIGNRTYYRSL